MKLPLKRKKETKPVAPAPTPTESPPKTKKKEKAKKVQAPFKARGKEIRTGCGVFVQEKGRVIISSPTVGEERAVAIAFSAEGPWHGIDANWLPFFGHLQKRPLSGGAVKIMLPRNGTGFFLHSPKSLKKAIEKEKARLKKEQEKSAAKSAKSSTSNAAAADKPVTMKAPKKKK
ncbi:MAG: hypothetical protein KDD64_07120 [Bdellovibrionales bacterium]|nr:hypothetical protein [Bdellovibrionales bacterium]